MRGDLSAVVIGACLLMATWTVVTAIRDRRVGDAHLIGLAFVELLLLAQLVVGLAAVIGGEGPDSTLTFLAYLVGALVVLPVATVWSLAERSRPSVLVLTVACLALPVMTARLLQMWQASGG